MPGKKRKSHGAAIGQAFATPVFSPHWPAIAAAYGSPLWAFRAAHEDTYRTTEQDSFWPAVGTPHAATYWTAHKAADEKTHSTHRTAHAAAFK